MISKNRFVTLLNPSSIFDMTQEMPISEWDDLLRVLRASQLLSSFAFALSRSIPEALPCLVQEKAPLLHHQPLNSPIPDFIKPHLTSAMIFSDAQERQVIRAANIIQKQMIDVGVDLIFLKGAAYALAKTANAKGRLFSDIDILVHKQDMPKIEKHLLANGWDIKSLDDYDEKYYREWSHELPPFTHRETGASLDIHHTLLPPISGYQIDLDSLWSSHLKTEDGFGVPDLGFMILHSTIHLLLNEDVEKGLRDLVDINSLLKSYCEKQTLKDLQNVFSGSGCDQEFTLLLTILDELFAPSYLQASSTFEHTLSFTGSMFCRAVFPPCSVLKDSSAIFARAWVYTRGHLKKMPLSIFTKHIVYKSYRAATKKLFGDFIFR